MCLGAPMKIIELRGDKALAECVGIKKEINVSLVPETREGDYVIIHAGFAISKLVEE